VPFHRKKILFLNNEIDFFLSHRRPLALAALAAGFEVHVAGPRTQSMEAVVADGFAFHHVPITRSGVSITEELKSVLAIYRLIRELKPDIVHNVALKAVLYGSIAGRLAATPVVVNALTGLGYVFIAQDLKRRILRRAIMTAMRFAFRQRKHRLILQNHDDPQLFLESSVVREEEVVIIRGSGVDMTTYQPEAEPPGEVQVVLASRMLWDKGVGEFVAAAREHRRRGGKARFLLVGDRDPGNPASVPLSQLEEWAREGVVEWLGYRDDVAEIFASSHIVCLPSYREGLPKVLIEAAACGCAIVASDVPGCREIVMNGHNGLLVPVRDPIALADAVWTLAQDEALRKEMAQKGRALAVSEFSVEKVVRETLSVYGELLAE
jgi:glycosyltransferase involved in cell wall biosynthesis